MKWAWLIIRVVLSLALGLLGPHHNLVHDGYEPVGPYLFRRATAYAFVEAYIIACVTAFILLAVLGWAWRRLAIENRMNPRAPRIALLGCATAVNVCIASMVACAAITGPPATMINRRPGNDEPFLLVCIAVVVVSGLALIGTLRRWPGSIVLKAVSMTWAGLWCLVILAGVFHLTA